MIQNAIHKTLDAVAVLSPNYNNEMTPHEARQESVKFATKVAVLGATAVGMGIAASHAGHEITNYMDSHPGSSDPIPDVIHLPSLHDEQVSQNDSNLPPIYELPRIEQYDIPAVVAPVEQK